MLVVQGESEQGEEHQGLEGPEDEPHGLGVWLWVRTPTCVDVTAPLSATLR
jgi:hypothetical protein